MPAFLTTLWLDLVAILPTLLIAIVVLVVGWLVAIAASSLTRRILQRTGLENRMASLLEGSENPRPENVKVENWIASAVFWIIIFFTVVAFFQVLNLTAVSGPLGSILTPILAFIPRLISAFVLLVVAWLIATVLRLVVTRVLSASGLVRKTTENAEVEPRNQTTIAQTIGNVVYWLVFLLFLPAILSALDMTGILAPVQTMVNNILSYLPNILGAALIFLVGYFVARIVRQIVTNILAGLGVDNIGHRAGVPTDQVRISDVIGLIVYVLILIPVTIAALNALNIPAVSVPASNMLTQILTALPNIFAALVVLAIAYFIGRLLGQFVTALLEGIGFNHFFETIGFYRPTGVPTTGRSPGEAASQAYSETTGTTPPPSMTHITPAGIVGSLVTVAVMLFAAMEAARLLGFAALATLISSFIVVGFQVLIGLIVFALGLYISAWAARAIRDTGSSQAYILAPAARVAIIVFAGALALRQMGIADSIVNLAFGLLLGAVAVAAALAFGLGGREWAKRQLDNWNDMVVSRQMIPNTGNQNNPHGQPNNPPPDIPTGGAPADRTNLPNTGGQQNYPENTDDSMGHLTNPADTDPNLTDRPDDEDFNPPAPTI